MNVMWERFVGSERYLVDFIVMILVRGVRVPETLRMSSKKYVCQSIADSEMQYTLGERRRAL